MSKFKSIFNQEDLTRMPIYNYQSRILGLFSEEIVKVWATSPYSNYEYLGRPTIYVNKIKPNDKGKYTVDFALQAKTDNPDDKKIYITEMKCWLPYDNFKYFELTEESLNRAANAQASFHQFLNIAKRATPYSSVKITGKPPQKLEKVDGFILIWGKVKPDNVEELKHATGLHDILGLEDMIHDMTNKEYKPYVELIEKYQGWSNTLFDQLKAK
jgi:hypothetical protein